MGNIHNNIHDSLSVQNPGTSHPVETKGARDVDRSAIQATDRLSIKASQLIVAPPSHYRIQWVVWCKDEAEETGYGKGFGLFAEDLFVALVKIVMVRMVPMLKGVQRIVVLNGNGTRVRGVV